MKLIDAPWNRGIRRIFRSLRGGPWVEARGERVSANLTRYDLPETITVTANDTPISFSVDYDTGIITLTGEAGE